MAPGNCTGTSGTACPRRSDLRACDARRFVTGRGSCTAKEALMDQKRTAQNLGAVEAHFHSEAANEVAAALELYTDDIVWEAPALNGLNRSYSGKEAVAK